MPYPDDETLIRIEASTMNVEEVFGNPDTLVVPGFFVGREYAWLGFPGEYPIGVLLLRSVGMGRYARERG